MGHINLWVRVILMKNGLAAFAHLPDRETLAHKTVYRELRHRLSGVFRETIKYSLVTVANTPSKIHGS